MASFIVCNGGLLVATSKIVGPAKGLSMKRASLVLSLALAAMLPAQAAWSQTLKTVKDRGTLNCGANGTLGGFGLPDAQGNWTGLDVDFCRAVAAAVLGDAKKTKFVALSAKDRFTASSMVAKVTVFSVILLARK